MATEHFNKLTEAEQERLVILAEECAEVIQVVAKIQRHGFNSDNRIHRAMDAKAVHIRQYLHHQPQPESIRD